MKLQTKAVHAGERQKLGAFIPISTPIYASSSFFYERMEVLTEVFADERPGQTYARLGNPSSDALEEQLAALEGADCAFSTASGMAAVHLAVMAGLVDRRQSIVAANVLYGGTLEFLASVLRPAGATVEFCDFCDLDSLEKTVKETQPALLLVETVSNPVLRVADVDRIAEIAHNSNSLLLVDNTFTPLLQRPLEHGADMVIYSATKYLGGHGDVLSGIVAAPQEQQEVLRLMQRTLGGNLGPFEAFLTMRGIKTLPLRMRRHCANAHLVADWLGKHSAVKAVNFPGDKNHPDAEVVARLMPAGQAGGAISFDVRGGEKAAFDVLDRLQLTATAASIGDLHSLAIHPASTTHRLLDPEIRHGLGITEGLIRLSVGAEDISDILMDLDQALGAA